MELRSLSILVSTLLAFILGTYVFAKNPKRIINISFLALLYSSGAWALSLFVLSIGTRYEVLKFAGHMAFSTGSLMACHFLLFAYVFPEKSEEFPSLRTLLLIYVPTALVVAAGFTPLVMKDITYVNSSVRPVYGKGIFFVLIYDTAYSTAGLYLLARKYLSRPGGFERAQLKYMLWGMLLTVVGIVAFALLLPLVGNAEYSSPFTAVLIMLATGAISYAIVRHRLMDLGVVFRNALIYVIMVTALSVAVILLLLMIMPVLRLDWRDGTFLAVALAALLVYPVRHGVEVVVDRYFFRGRYNYQAALTEFSSSMTRILDLEDLQNRIVHEVASILQVKTAALLLYEPNEQTYTVRASLPASLKDLHHGIPASSPVSERINKERSLLVKEEIKRMLPRSEYEPLRPDFERIEAEVFIPLIYRGELIGLLTLGEKCSTDIYSSEDLNLLVTLGNQAAVALENALLHYTVTMLKNHNDNILKYMSSGVIAIDREQVINTCNEKAREVLKLAPAGVINKKIDVLPPLLRSMLADTLNGRTRFSNQDVQILTGDVTTSYLSASTSLIRDERGDVIGALLVFNDLTDIKRIESEMWRADKLASLGTLAAGMAHEIKNPLVSIKTFAQLLPSKYEDKDFRDTFSSITVDEVERINTIVEKLLEFARPSAPTFGQVDVIEVIDEVLLLLSSEVVKLGITVTKNYEVSSAPIVGDKGQLKQAMLNLCLNAMQAIDGTGRAGDLTISVGFRKSRYRRFDGIGQDQVAQMFYGAELVASTDDAETLLIKVRDTGKGISRENLPRIFDPFFTTKEKGLGLGLAVVHGIIKDHSGNITVDSKKNVGTEFTISLPVTQFFAKERV
jgi:two-component system sensor histidine kinase AtoS